MYIPHEELRLNFVAMCVFLYVCVFMHVFVCVKEKWYKEINLFNLFYFTLLLQKLKEKNEYFD